MWLVKETDAGKSGPTMELYEEQQTKTKKVWVHGLMPSRSPIARKEC